MVDEYDLLTRPWLPVRNRRSGDLETVGIAEALLRSHELADLVADVPTQIPALLRQVLLPVMVDAVGPPTTREEWARRFTAGRFTEPERERLSAYFDEYRDRFALFGRSRPFAQVANLRTPKGETKGTVALVATAPSGNNVPLFGSRTEGDPFPLTPGQAARWLLHTQCWDTAAIKSGAHGDPKVKAGKTTGNPTGPLGQLGVVVPAGRSLFETLLLNTPVRSQDMWGIPQWRREPAFGPEWDTYAPHGVLELWTWQARRVRLLPEEADDGLRVLRVVVAAGDRISVLPEWEPHTAWRVEDKPKPGTPARRPRRHTPGRAVWRGLESLLTMERRDGGTFDTTELLRQIRAAQMSGAVAEEYPLRVQTYGILYGNKSAVVEDLLHDAIPLPVAALRAEGEVYDVVVEATEQAEQLARAVNRLSADLRRAEGAEPIKDKGQPPGELVLHALDPLVRRLLAGISAAGMDVEVLARGQLAWERKAWAETMRIAERMLGTAGPGAFVGRKETGKNGKNGKDITYSLGTAERDFRARLAQILPRAAEHRAAQHRRDPE
ncbi:type I-E CRISPR-associated protein Cse1/CasA [Saccharomonospora xinjiangensis]|uniref:type I-E CRISPR-associated protein Cse1/CasA n=1 Tax=Saccharomonospora xinjiangensis TaxID=75294 RepID=UPI0035105A6D